MENSDKKARSSDAKYETCVLFNQLIRCFLLVLFLRSWWWNSYHVMLVPCYVIWKLMLVTYSIVACTFFFVVFLSMTSSRCKNLFSNLRSRRPRITRNMWVHSAYSIRFSEKTSPYGAIQQWSCLAFLVKCPGKKKSQDYLDRWDAWLANASAVPRLSEDVTTAPKLRQRYIPAVFWCGFNIIVNCKFM